MYLLSIEVRMWNRNVTVESVEEALTKSDGESLEFCPEHQGESIAFEPGGKGFYTTTEIDKRDASHKFAPIYYYSFSYANLQKVHSLLVFFSFIISIFHII